jgi:PHD/YefM family antitoxin component YafN of YafNO toxin-antitoxin module
MEAFSSVIDTNTRSSKSLQSLQMASMQQSHTVALSPSSSLRPLTSFHLSPKLSTELRLMIREVALPGPRILFLNQRQIRLLGETKEEVATLEAEEWELYNVMISDHLAQLPRRSDIGEQREEKVQSNGVSRSVFSAFLLLRGWVKESVGALRGLLSFGNRITTLNFLQKGQCKLQVPPFRPPSSDHALYMP